MFKWLNPLQIFLNPIEKIADSIAKYQSAKAQAETDEKRMEYDLKIKMLEERAKVLINESPKSPSAWVRTWIGAVIAFFLTKVYIGDKALGQWTGWTTDNLSPELWQVVMIVITFYFVYETVNLWKRK